MQVFRVQSSFVDTVKNPSRLSVYQRVGARLRCASNRLLGTKNPGKQGTFLTDRGRHEATALFSLDRHGAWHRRNLFIRVRLRARRWN